MKRRFIALLVAAALGFMSVTAQEEPSSLSLTVNEAMEFAVENNRSVSSARYDLLASEKGVWEAMAAGLPSIDASSSLGYNLAIMTRIIDFNGVQTALKFGTLYDLSYGVSASTILFNAPWMVGIQTARLASTLAGQGLKQTEIETRESVMTAYYLILISEETLKVLDANLANLNEILNSTKAMYSVGMAEATDVDQMQASVTMLQNTKASMARSLEVNYNMMRFLLGVGRGTELILTESLDAIIEGVNVASLLGEEFILEENISFSLIESQTKMSELSLKGAKATVLPSLGASIYYNRNGMGDKLNDLQFFPNSMLGFQLQVPIFGSGVRYTKIKKAQINLEKAQNTKAMVSDQLLMQEKQLRYNLLSASEQYKNQKNNIEIADRVLKSFQNKYNQGMASSLDLTQANNNYLTAQNNYLSSLMNLLQTKTAFDKLMNNL
ncbi:MAG TPA: TolC family protein [Bacteroidales bacterium]|nr:TolC family protein [Bacteroidales bacterium]